MKKLRIVLLTVAVILIGAGAAFATNASKNAGNTMKPGHYIDSSTEQCLDARKQCSTVGSTTCRWTDPSTGITYSLHELVGTSCGSLLFEPETP